jgi:hypothetical protein
MTVADWADGLDLLWVIGLVGMVAGLLIYAYSMGYFGGYMVKGGAFRNKNHLLYYMKSNEIIKEKKGQ